MPEYGGARGLLKVGSIASSKEMMVKSSHQLEADIGKVQCLGGIGQINCCVHGSMGGELERKDFRHC